MQLCSSNSVHGLNGHEGGASRDSELVDAAKAGSSAAFEELQSRYSRRLYRRIQSITRNREDTEDALQETFLRAYLGLNSFEGRSQFASWLTRIAINSALMILRKRRSRAEVSFEGPSESGEPDLAIDVRETALNPEQLYNLRQRSECALRAISRLNTTLRLPMTTWIQQECSLKEVACALELSLSSVKSRLYRARKQIRYSTAFTVRASNADSISGPKHQHDIPEFRNRELLCSSCD
jgi:RNA polymerase sigma-70 factor (ECF subfamily)